jgi:hypothetical protein
VDDSVSVGWQNILGPEHDLSIRYHELIAAAVEQIDFDLLNH